MARPIRRRIGAAPIPWYLKGGIPRANVLGAWQPKGAASYAASKISLINPSASNLLADGAAAPTWAATTGWTFVAASAQYLTIASAITAATPVSMICRFNADDADNAYGLVSINDYSAVSGFVVQIAGNVAGDPLRMTNWVTDAQTTSGFAAATWFTAIGISASNASRAIYINGTDKGTETTPTAPSGLDNTYIGCWALNSALGGHYSGKISACAIYNIALSDAQSMALHNSMVAAGL